MAMYFPPRMQEGAKAETRYRRTTQDSIDWASGVIPEGPHRTLAIIGSDLNDGLEMCQGQRQRSVAHSNGCLAEEGCADTLFRLMIEEQKLYVASGHTDETITPPQSTRTYEDYRLRYHPRSYAEPTTRATTLLRKWKDSTACEGETATGP